MLNKNLHQRFNTNINNKSLLYSELQKEGCFNIQSINLLQEYFYFEQTCQGKPTYNSKALIVGGSATNSASVGGSLSTRASKARVTAFDGRREGIWEEKKERVDFVRTERG